jgi:chemotaxis protein CheX
MSPGVEFIEVCEFMEGHFIEVSDTMLGIAAKPVAKREPPEQNERVSGFIGLSGDRLRGGIYLHSTIAFAKRATATIYGSSSEQIQREGGIKDAVAELTNLLAGGLRSWLCGQGIVCAVSIPSILRGTSFIVVPAPDVVRQKLVFECGEELVAVEIHIQRG